MMDEGLKKRLSEPIKAIGTEKYVPKTEKERQEHEQFLRDLKNWRKKHLSKKETTD